MKILLNLLLNGIAVFITAYVLPGVDVDNFITALIVAVVLGVLNTFLKPILLLLTLPLNLLTLGLFTFVINIALILLASSLITGFAVAGILWALAFSLVLSIVNSFFGMLK